MKKILSYILILSLILVGILGLSGCSQDSATTALAIVVGNHKNFPITNFMSGEIYGHIYDTAYSYGQLNVIVVDGAPYVSAAYDINKPDKNIDNAKRKQIAKQNTQTIISECETAIAKTAEIDTLGAINKGGGLLSSSNCDEKTMLIYDSGLSTTGLLNFAKENIIDADVTQVIDRLKELHALPSLDSVNIIWTGLGEVSGEQDTLTSNYKFKLKKLWEAIITASGGTVKFIETALIDESPNITLPECSVVPIVADTLNVSAITDPIKLGEETVKFIGDKAEFINPSEAIDVLKPLADIIKKSDTAILLVGTTATAGSKESCRKLSLARCETVKKVLINNGVSEDKVYCIGLGYTDTCLRVTDRSSSGELIESEARKNRAVYILNYNSQLAEELLTLV